MTCTNKVAVLIPCYNEEKTIGKVISDFKNFLPDADIFVFDNNSSDKTAETARISGATVIPEKRQGKGYVIASMFEKLVYDYYIMADGDDTYPAEYAPEMLKILQEDKADIVVGNRLKSYSDTDTRAFHTFGNKLVRVAINIMLGSKIKDPMSGYRAFNYNAIQKLPFMASGFDIETEMTIQALHQNLVINEIDIKYRDRPEGSESKLNTFSDGIKVLVKIFLLAKAYKPLTLFGFLGLLSVACGILFFGMNIFQMDRLEQHLLGYGLILAGFIFILSGVVIHTINYRILEGQVLMFKYQSHQNINRTKENSK